MSPAALESTLIQLVFLLLGTLIASAVSVPFIGVLVRYRANYNPRVVQIDGEGGQIVAAHAGPPVYGYFAMMKRVYMLEGISGFFKGFVPMFLSSTAYALVFILLGFQFSWTPFRIISSNLGLVGSIIFLVMSSILDIPLQILINRAIVTPYKLPIFNLRTSFKVLLTPTERRRPWMLYLSPGVLASAGMKLVTTILPLSGGMFVLQLFMKVFSLLMTTAMMASLVLLWNVICAIVLAPVGVVSVRLMVQRNHWDGMSVRKPEWGSEELRTQPEEAEEAGVKEYCSEDVIALRDEQDPYLGFMDCLNRIAREEGWRVLFRAWWITFIAQYVF